MTRDPNAPNPPDSDHPRPSTAEPCASSRSSTTASSSGEPETLDLRGEVCPYTFVYARLRLESMPLGSALEILVDHEPATRNLPRSARQWGQEVLCVEAIESSHPGDPGDPSRPDAPVWRIVVEKRVP